MLRSMIAETDARDGAIRCTGGVRPRRHRAFWAWLAGALAVLPIAKLAAFEVTPAQVVLDEPESTQQLLVDARADDGRPVDATRTAEYRSADESIAVVDELGLIRPLRDGATTILIRHADEERRVAVTVKDVDRPQPVSFARDVIPILSKAGCNSGGCHGKAEGQNGFKFSVFGFDPAADYEAIAKQSRGRRLFVAAPERSLLLRKATADEPHGGGQRLEVGSLRYRRLIRWIAEGARPGAATTPSAAMPNSDAPRSGAADVVRIEVEPAERVLLAHGKQQLRVWAVDDTGTRRCVTTEAEYVSNAATIATIDGRGFVQAADVPGEAALLARYLGHVAVCRVTIPRPGVTFPRPAEDNFIDGLAWNKLERLGIEPSGRCDDATFLRRAFLDAIGTLPTADEARAFLADGSPDKRPRLVDRLLDRPEYADYWTMRFSDLLRVDQTKITPAGAVSITRWLHRQFAENRPYDAMVRELLTAKGNVAAEGPAAYYKALDKPDLLARSVCQVFLGVRIECAQCHHHPSDRWGQDDYVAMAGLFSGVTHKKLPDGGQSIVPGLAKDLPHPRTGLPVAARPLGAEPAEFAPYDDRRVRLADWMLADANPLFAAMIVNRLWAHYFGCGLVEPIDDLRTTNPATNEPLLAALADHMRRVRYDLKAFTRILLNSRLYQASAETTASNAADDQNFSHAARKALPAEVLLDGINQATGVVDSFEGWPAGYRAIQIWDNKLPSYFFRIFGRPVRATVCECERSGEPSIAQALHLMDSPEIMEKLHARHGRAARLALSDWPAERIIEELFLSTLSRYPREPEQLAMLEAFSAGADRRQTVEDVLWALLNSKEFLYNH